MNPYFFVYKSIGITWFSVLTIIGVLASYFISNNFGKEYNLEENKIEDIFYILVLSGFIGARLTYGIFHIDFYKENLWQILKPSHMNLSLAGGVIFALLSLVIMGKKYEIPFYSLIKVYIVPFYFSMALGVWAMRFEGLFMENDKHPVVLYLSLLFLLGMIIEWIQFEKIDKKYITYMTFVFVMILYYMIKGGLL